jgi:hypothetical protein
MLLGNSAMIAESMLRMLRATSLEPTMILIQCAFLFAMLLTGTTHVLAVAFDIVIAVLLSAIYFSPRIKAKNKRWYAFILIVNAGVFHGLAMPAVHYGGQNSASESTNTQ